MSDAASTGLAPRLVFPPGTVVEAKYRIERPLGQGEMGCVFLATHLRNGESIALKFMHPADPSQGPAAFAAFLHAARAAARFRSENVAHVRDMGMLEDGAPFLVMEYLEGGTLDSLIRARGALPVAQSVDLAMQAARGLADAHAAGVIHRDIKPSNLFLERIPNGGTHLKLLDFGGSRIIPRPGSSEDRRAPAPAVVGTFPYTSPEQIHAPNDVDERADIWSLGVVLYEMLTGEPPFRDETLVHIRERILTDAPASLRRSRSDVPAELEAVVIQCLEKRTDQRFAEMADLTLALAPFRTAERKSGPPRTGRSSPLPPPMPGAPAAVPTAPPAVAEPTLQALAEAAIGPLGGRESSSPESSSRESAHMAIVSPVVPPAASTAGAQPSIVALIADQARAIRARPRIPLLALGAALLIGGALVSAAATSGSEKPGAAREAESNAAVTANDPAPTPATHPEAPVVEAPQARVEPEPTTPPVAPAAAPPRPRAVPEPAHVTPAAAPSPAPAPAAPAPSEPGAAKTAARASAAPKSPTPGGAPPVGTSGFGERE